MRGAAAGRRWPERVPPRLGPLVELRTLLAIVGVALAAWAFAGLYDGVREGGRLDFDHRVLFMLREPGRPQDPLGPAWLESAVRDVTSLGGTPLVVFVTLAVAGYLALARKPGAAVLVLISILGAAVLGYLAKDAFPRPRPDLVPHAVVTYTSSFPSAHATGAAAAYLTLGALLARFERRRRLKAYVLSLAALITVAVGLSRIYLGVHWPTDVLAGWALGSGWALACWTVARLLQRRGGIEPETGADLPPGRPRSPAGSDLGGGSVKTATVRE
jgi:undecaprenyl-diphosphatase